MNYKAEKHFKMAKMCIKHSMPEQTVQAINAMLIDGGEDAEVYLNAGKLFIAIGNYQIAATYIRKSFDLEKSVETLELLANAHYNSEKYDLAAIEYEELIKHVPREDFYIYSMKAYEKKDYYEESIRIAKMYNEAFSNLSSYSELIIRYIVAGMEKEAIDTSNEMVEKFPNHYITYNTLGLLYECIYNDYEQAKIYFKKASKTGHARGFYNLGVCCKQSEDFENAEKYFNKLKILDEEVREYYNYSLGSVYLAQRKLRLGYKYYYNRRSAKV